MPGPDYIFEKGKLCVCARARARTRVRVGGVGG